MRHVTLFVIMAVLLFVVGCFDYEETLEFNADGSGTMIAHYEVDSDNISKMKMMYEELAKSMPDADIPTNIDDMYFNKQEIEEALDSENTGIKLLSYETSKNDKSHIWDMKFSFEDINNSYLIYDAVSVDEGDDEYSTEEEESPALLTKQSDGTLLFLRPLDNPEAGGEDSEFDSYGDEDYGEYDEYNQEDYDSEDGQSELAEQIEEEVSELEEGLNEFAEGMLKHKIIFNVKFPGKLIESNAHAVDGNTATWEYSFEELGKSNIEQRAVIQP